MSIENTVRHMQNEKNAELVLSILQTKKVYSCIIISLWNDQSENND